MEIRERKKYSFAPLTFFLFPPPYLLESRPMQSEDPKTHLFGLEARAGAAVWGKRLQSKRRRRAPSKREKEEKKSEERDGEALACRTHGFLTHTIF